MWHVLVSGLQWISAAKTTENEKIITAKTKSLETKFFIANTPFEKLTIKQWLFNDIFWFCQLNFNKNLRNLFKYLKILENNKLIVKYFSFLQ